MSSQDKRFFDIFMIVIGGLIAVAVMLIVLSRVIGSRTQEQWMADDAQAAQRADERLRPFGRVAVPGDAGETAGAEAAAAPVATALSGPQVYNAACLACHGAGIGGAPKSGDKAAWAPRIAQGTATLQKHTLEGFQGQAGYMPPKGGRVDLSDQEVLAAMQYMVEQAR